MLRNAYRHLRRGTLGARLKWSWYQARRLTRVGVDIELGARLYLYPGDELSRYIFCGGYENVEREFVTRFLRPGDRFVDVGANIGLYTVIAAKAVGPLGRVYAFEPAFETFGRLEDNVALNELHNVSCIRAALSDSTEAACLVVAGDGFSAWNSIQAESIESARPQHGFETVSTETWDSFAREHDLVGAVAMMKIDVEGWETHVLGGAAECLKRADAPVLQIEFTDEVSRAADSSCTELYSALRNLDYEMFEYDSRTRSLAPSPLRAEYPYLNLLAIKDYPAVMGRIQTGPRSHAVS